MGTPGLGEIKMVAFDFAPRGWALCDGRLLPVNQNQPLFSLLGITFGGDGINTFGLPDLRGRVPAHVGGTDGLFRLGEQFGVEAVTLGTAQLPSHAHPVTAGGGNANSDVAAGNVWATISDNQHPLYATSIGTTMSGQCTTQVGGGQAHENRQPYLTLNYIIALIGVFPRPDQ